MSDGMLITIGAACKIALSFIGLYAAALTYFRIKDMHEFLGLSKIREREAAGKGDVQE